ncbi:MAG: nucleotide exchange factor GrpE [Clostridiales bacterium]|nr:nucleotide exchange factor GrpE [Clostridiales bacterium]
MAKENAKKKNQAEPSQQPETESQQPAASAADQVPEVEPETAAQAADEAEQLRKELAEEKDRYLRLAAEYDNFRKRSQKERDGLYTDLRAETVSRFLPVYDNLERALNQPTADEAYKKGVEMTMTGLVEIMQKLGVTAFGEAGDAFDPSRHNAVMHIEDDSLDENVIAEVFQKGFLIEDKVVRFAMVKVAN